MQEEKEGREREMGEKSRGSKKGERGMEDSKRREEKEE